MQQFPKQKRMLKLIHVFGGCGVDVLRLKLGVIHSFHDASASIS